MWPVAEIASNRASQSWLMHLCLCHMWLQWAVGWLCQRLRDPSLQRTWRPTAPAAPWRRRLCGWYRTPWWQSVHWSSSSCCSCWSCPADGETGLARSRTSPRWSDTASNDSEGKDGRTDSRTASRARPQGAAPEQPPPTSDTQFNVWLTFRLYSTAWPTEADAQTDRLPLKGKNPSPKRFLKQVLVVNLCCSVVPPSYCHW